MFCISRWSLPVGPTQVMAAVKEGPWKSLSSGKKVALAAGLSVGATVGYLVYRHIRSSSGKLQTLASFSVLLTILFQKSKNDSVVLIFFILFTLFIIISII